MPSFVCVVSSSRYRASTREVTARKGKDEGLPDSKQTEISRNLSKLAANSVPILIFRICWSYTAAQLKGGCSESILTRQGNAGKAAAFRDILQLSEVPAYEYHLI